MSAPRNRVLTGDALDVLRTLPDGLADCVVTSPPYFRLRDYGAGAGELGREESVEGWVAGLRAIAVELARVLAPRGTLWLNVGDAFSRHGRHGAPPKGLLLGPERLLLALSADGWIVRNKLVWAKANTRPSSVRDRLSCRWEPVYLLTRQPSYHFDLDAIRRPHASTARPRPSASAAPSRRGELAGRDDGLAALRRAGRVGHVLGKNPGDVWTTPSSNYRGAHFATFPEALIDPIIRAGCPERVCTGCGRAWRRRRRAAPDGSTREAAGDGGWERCGCGLPTRPGLVLDPFFGAGTTGLVAARLRRDWLGVELKAAYVTLAERRMAAARRAA